MKNIVCPQCQGTLFIEHYQIPLAGTMVRGISSRLVCKTCPYKKEPKTKIDPRYADIIRQAEKNMTDSKLRKKKDNFPYQEIEAYE